MRGFQAMNGHTNAKTTQDMQLPVLPDPEMNHKLTQQQQQLQLARDAPQQEVAANLAGGADANIGREAAQKSQQAADSVTSTADNAARSAAEQLNTAASG